MKYNSTLYIYLKLVPDQKVKRHTLVKGMLDQWNPLEILLWYFSETCM